MGISWNRNADLLFAEARAKDMPILVDFSAAPACVGCARLESESYSNEEISRYIHRHFLPLRICSKEVPIHFDQFEVFWTPTVLFLDSTAKERYRIEGYLPPREFAAYVVLGLGRLAFTHKEWEKAEDYYARIIMKYSDTTAVAEALYWGAVCCYKQTNDIRVLTEMSYFSPQYKDSVWAIKGSVLRSALR